MGDSHPGLRYRADLQGLRALAIALVVLAHAGLPGLAGGFVGVDVFFVLSGYLISGLLLRERIATGHIRFLDFIARRLRRLLPALLTMLVTTTGLGLVLLSGHEFSEQTASVAYAATWTSNLYFALTTFDYFAELHLRDLFLHTWSLGVEEQFYLVWPLLTWLAAGLAERPGGQSVSSPRRASRRRRLLMSTAAVFAASLALSLYWSATNSLWAFYLTPSRVWQFALGAAVFIWFEVDRDAADPVHVRSPAAWYGVQWGGIAVIAGSAVLLSPAVVYPGLWALLPSVGAAMVIAAGCAVPGNRVGGILAHPSAVWLGDRSYSLYLWHWPVLMFGFAWGLQGNVSATVGLLGLAVLLAIASYRWVELPFWKGRFSRQAALRSIVYAVSCIAVVGVSTTELIALMYDEEQRVAQFAREVRNDIPSIYVQGCDSWFRDSDLEPCAVGDASAARTAVLIGDSVGVHWYSLLPAVFKSPDWRIVVLTKSACAMVDEDYVYPVAGGVYAVCTEWRNKALDYLDRLRPDVVFVGSASTYDFNERQWVEGSKRVLARLASGAGQVVLIAGTPMLSFDGPGCLERWMRDHGGAETPPADLCSEPLQGKSSTIVTPWLARAAAGFSNVTLLDLNDLVCPRGRCAARQVDGVVVFRDQRHLTDSFVRARAGEFARRLDGLGLTDGIPASR